VLVVKVAGRGIVAWCFACGEQARMVTIEEAMALTGASSREIHRRLEARGIHFTETAQGFVLICLGSLLR
jgi:hypothetical protein